MRSIIGALAFLAVGSVMPWLRLPTAQIEDSGIYSAEVTTYGDWAANGPVGVNAAPDSVKLIQSVVRIPSKPGVYWGVRVNLTNPYTTGNVDFQYKFTHPPFTTPDGKVQTGDCDDLGQVEPGQTTQAYCMWFFIKECPYEFVPGEWTLTITADGQEVLRKVFEIYAPDKSYSP